jgi:hypothetical protein
MKDSFRVVFPLPSYLQLYLSKLLLGKDAFETIAAVWSLKVVSK